MSTSSPECYLVFVNEDNSRSGILVGLENWGGMMIEKDMAQIIIDAANYSLVKGHLNHSSGKQLFSYFPKPPYDEIDHSMRP